MIPLQDAIIEYANKHIDEINAWYDWAIDIDNLPAGINLAEGNQYAQNIELKNKLNKAWRTGDDARKRELTHYYIYHWGGIRTNLPKTITSYTVDAPEQLIARKTQGIASWSKALCARNANTHAIFDARVSASLNSLQIIHNVDQKILFPILPSRNNVIKKGNKRLKTMTNLWERNNAGFYKTYLKLLDLLHQNK
ncbi:MAG: hypothetical protein Q8N30_05665 [Methylococcales bacterium]|nr:hypothetical protein [Methylococcales bacterium]